MILRDVFKLGPTRDELRAVIAAIRRSEDAEAIALLDAAAENDDTAFVEVERIAVAAGSTPHAMLDLVVAWGSGVESLRRGPRSR